MHSSPGIAFSTLPAMFRVREEIRGTRRTPMLPCPERERAGKFVLSRRGFVVEESNNQPEIIVHIM